MNKEKGMGARARGMVLSAVIVVILCLFAFAQIFPFYLQLVRSLQPPDFYPLYGKLYLWPEAFHFSNYVKAFVDADLGRGTLNTLIVCILFTGLSCMMVLLAGYVLGKKKFRGQNAIFIIFLATMMVPGEVLLVPNYFLMIQLGMYDSLTALFLPGLVNIFGVFLVKQFMYTIPDSILEAAKLDGINEVKMIFYIILPLSLPVIGTYVIITFIATWNDYLWPSIILKTDTIYTLQMKLMYFNPAYATPEDQTLRAAGVIVTMFPLLVMYFIFQKQLIEGVSLSGLK